MSNLYSLESDCDRYWNLRLENEERDWEHIYQFDGRRLGDDWEPLAVLADEQQIDKQPASDYPHLFAEVPVLSTRAVTVLKPILESNGELLPLHSNDGEYFIFNVLRFVDALNEEASEIVRFPDGKRILEIERFVFDTSKVKNVDIFKLPQQPLGRVFVSDKFVDVVRKAGLLGFNFEWLWSSDQRSSSSVIYNTNLQ